MKQPKLSSKPGKGWFGESTRHAMSAQGVKTGKRSTKPIYTTLGSDALQAHTAKELSAEGIDAHAGKKKIEGIAKNQRTVFGVIEFGDVDEYGTPIITVASELPKTRFGKIYHKVRYGHKVPTQKAVMLHETLHYYHPEKSERSISQLERHQKKKYLRWWER
jgi:hypothetical protein